MNAVLTEPVLSRLGEFATSVYGLRFPPDRWPELSRGVAAAALELGVSDLAAWVESLLNGGANSEELAALANHLTISETYFFRQRDAFDALERQILPERIAQRQLQAKSLRIWSAGCASGEEPYSVAILIRQRFPAVRPETVVILATDVASHVLARASRGRYSEWSFRDAPDWLKPGYFTTRGVGKYEIKPEVRHMVRFSALNLAAAIYPAEFGERGDFDVILCRNVLMYFSADWQQRIIRRFAAALSPGGWLLVGPCDIPAELAVELRLQSTRPGQFQKKSHPIAFPMPLPVSTPAAPVPAVPAVESVRAQPPPAVASPAAPVPPAPPPVLPPAPPDALARAYADRGELDAALAACDEALRTNNLDADMQHLRAHVLLELGRAAEAEVAFRRVLYLQPDSVMAHFALASLAQRQSRADEARHHLAMVLRMLAHHNRGEPVPQGEGLTVGRLRELVERSLEEHAA